MLNKLRIKQIASFVNTQTVVWLKDRSGDTFFGRVSEMIPQCNDDVVTKLIIRYDTAFRVQKSINRPCHPILGSMVKDVKIESLTDPKVIEQNGVLICICKGCKITISTKPDHEKLFQELLKEVT